MKTRLATVLATLLIVAHADAGDKVEMCHRGSTIIVSVKAAIAHLGHGDAIGVCEPAIPPSPPEPLTPTDTDSDGVADNDDACPDTSSEADANGCSCAQRGDCDSDGDGVYDQNDDCPSTPAGDAVYDDGCTVVTLSAFAGPDMDALPGDIVDVVGQGSVLTGDYDSADLVYLWEQTGGDPVGFSSSSPPLIVDTVGASGDLTFTLTVSTADGSASATDEFAINIESARATSVATGKWHNILMLNDGSIRLWGWDMFGQLGDGSMSGIASADGGALDTIVVRDDGTAWSFGYTSASPELVSGDEDIVQASALDAGGMLLASDGTVLGFGDNNNCELGTAAGVGLIKIPGLPTNITAIDSGSLHSVALDADGNAWVWGWSFGCTPRSVLDDVVSVSAGDSGHCLLLRADGTAWALGFNLHGQLGNGTRTTNYNTPSQVSGLTDVAAVAAGDRHSMFLKSDGTLWTCGRADDGRLGLSGDELASAGADLLYGKHLTVPKQVGLSGVISMAGGMTHSVAVLGDGTVWAWGFNTYGQVGSGLPDTVATPVQLDLDGPPVPE